MKSGIYKIQSIAKPDRVYIGSAVNINMRWANHSSHLRLQKHHSPQLQRHYNKYGINDLVFSIIEICKREDLLVKEQYFLDLYNPYFNTLKIAGSQLGAKRTEETKRKIGEKSKNRSPESNKRMADKLRGRKIPRDVVEKVAAAHRGLKHTAETKLKMSIASKNRPPMAQETKDKISKSKKGKKMSSEFIEKMRVMFGGENNPMHGRHHSEETRKKMSSVKKEKKLERLGLNNYLIWQ